MAADAIVICVRDPDASNEFSTFARGGLVVDVVDVDAGRGDLSSPEEFREWAQSHLATADRLREEGWKTASESLSDIVESYRGIHRHPEVT